MKVAYFIMAHHKPNVLLRMLQAIYTPDNIYMIHVDAKANTALHQLVNDLAKDNGNIKVLPPRAATWACWSLVQLELDAIKELLQYEWDYYLNLSGQDFPLVKQSVLNEFLKNSGDKNYVTYRQCIDSEKALLNKYYIEDCGSMKILGERKPFDEYFIKGIDCYIGSQWKILKRNFCEYAVTSSLAFDMQDYYRYTLVPDEMYFPTLILNSPFRETVVNKNYRYIQMDDGSETSGISRPVTVTMSLFIDMYKSEAMFARKFDDAVDESVIQMVESTLK